MDESENNTQGADRLYDYMKPKAEAVKVVIQMLIGIAVVVLVLLKLFFMLYPPTALVWGRFKS